MIHLARIAFLIIRYGVVSAFLIAVLTPLLKPFGINLELITQVFEKLNLFTLPDPQVSAKQLVKNGQSLDYYIADYDFAINKWIGCFSSWRGQGECLLTSDLLALTFILVGLTLVTVIAEMRFVVISFWKSVKRVSNQLYAHKICTAILAVYSVFYWHLYKFILETTKNDIISYENVQLIDERAVYAGCLLTIGEAAYVFIKRSFQKS